MTRSKAEQSAQDVYLDALWTRREGRDVLKKPEPDAEGASFMYKGSRGTERAVMGSAKVAGLKWKFERLT